MKDKLDDCILNAVSAHVAQSMNNAQMDIMLDMIQEAGLCQEFEDFIDSDDHQYTNAEEYFTEFAKLYPDKFYIVPEEKRHAETHVVMLD